MLICAVGKSDHSPSCAAKSVEKVCKNVTLERMHTWVNNRHSRLLPFFEIAKKNAL